MIGTHRQAPNGHLGTRPPHGSHLACLCLVVEICMWMERIPRL